jgi:ABC-2 type transport system permease protein
LLCVFRLAWIERLIYRVHFFLEIMSGILSTLILVFLWMAIYRNAPHEVLGGYSLGQMITYVMGGGFINTFIFTTSENLETDQSIRDGTLSSLLIRPVSPYGVWFMRDLSSKTFFLLLGLLTYGVVFFFFREFLASVPDLWYFTLFVFSLCMACLIQFFLFEAVSLLAFWVENTYGLRFNMLVMMQILGGAIIPLSFFPHILQKVFLFLPFPFLIYLPMRIYLGKIALHQLPAEFLKEALWISGLAIFNMVMWKKGIRRYAAMGD